MDNTEFNKAMNNIEINKANEQYRNIKVMTCELRQRGETQYTMKNRDSECFITESLTRPGIGCLVEMAGLQVV
jgi:hypothetical protein